MNYNLKETKINLRNFMESDTFYVKVLWKGNIVILNQQKYVTLFNIGVARRLHFRAEITKSCIN